MADDIGARPGGAGAWGQAFTALVLVGSLGVGLWAVGQAESAERARKPAACSGGGPEEPVRSDGETARHVSGAELCAALNRPDLADLLGTGEELATIAYGRGGSRRDADGQEIATPTARVEIGGYTVALSATYSHLPWPRTPACSRTARDRGRSWAAPRTSTRTGRSTSASASGASPPRPVPVFPSGPSSWPGTRRTAGAPSM